MEITHEALLKMFETMVTIRQFELRAFAEVGPVSYTHLTLPTICSV